MRGLFGGARAEQPQVLALVDLVQDIDVMLPVLAALKAGARLKVRVSRWLETQSPRTAGLLRRHGLDFAYVRRSQVIEGRAPSLRGVHVVLTASESSHPAHAAGHALARRAVEAGLRAVTLQHGLEAVGLFGLEASQAAFASDEVICWFPKAATPPDLPAETRRKLAHLGRPDPPSGWPQDAEPRFDLGVFENLHWERYGEEDRSGFLAGLKALAEARPRLKLLVRPHPAGGWGDRLQAELGPFGQVTVQRAEDARASLDGPAELMAAVGKVITTPSTIALDSALTGRPVALAADGGAPYLPLPVVRTPQDWIGFADGARKDRSALDLFLSRVLVAGDAAPRIAGRIVRD